MAEEAAPSAARKMKLKIISNAEEIGTHVFDNIPVDTTIGWIKQHLQNTLPAHPPVEAQRILYQARYLEDNSTLVQILGDPVPEEQAFHLVFKAPRVARLNQSDQQARTSSAPADPSRFHAAIPGQNEAQQPEAQGQGSNVNPPRIEVNISNIGQQIQQALDQAQTQLQQAGFGHIQIPPVGPAIQIAAQAQVDGALSAAGLQGSGPTEGTIPAVPGGGTLPSVTVNHRTTDAAQQSTGQPPEASAPPFQQIAHQGPNIRFTQTFTGIPSPQTLHGNGNLGPEAMQAHQMHMQAHQRALEMATQQRQQIQRLHQMRTAQDQQRPHQPTPPPPLSAVNRQNGTPPPTIHSQHNQNHPRPVQAPPAAAGPFPIGILPGGVLQAGPFQMVPGMPPHQPFAPQPLPGQFNPFQGPFQGFQGPHPHLRGPVAMPAGQQRVRTPSQTISEVNARPASNRGDQTSSFSDRMQQIQRELEQVSRRTQELSSQRLTALGQMPSSVQQTELRDGFRTMAESLQRIQTTLDGLASDPAVANQAGFIPLRTLVQDWILQAQAVEVNLSGWLNQHDRDAMNAGSSTDDSASTVSMLQPSITAAFPPVSSPASAGTTDNLMLLRDPTGQPHGILIGPSGTYRTSDIPQAVVDRLFSQVRPPTNRDDSFSRFMRRTAGNSDPPTPAPRTPQDTRQALLEHVNAATARANQAPRDAARPAQPNQLPNEQGLQAVRNPRDGEQAANGLLRALVNPLWLVVRIVGMMYLFGGVGRGLSGWLQWRPLGIALLVIAAHVLQQPWMRRRIDAVRGHFEQLFGVPLPRPGAAAQVQPNRPQAQLPAGERLALEDGTPGPVDGQAAANIGTTQQDQQPQVGIRERFRAVERALALFAASLVPGMGEGIVEARQLADAEARRVEEEAARQERERQEAAAAAEQATQAGEEVDGGSESQEAVQEPESVSPTGDTAGSSTQIDVTNAEGNSELSRVNKGKDKAVDNGEVLPSSSSE